jgi:GNAT superfamily N-acetyltransferase
MGALSLRTVTPADDEFIFQTIKATMAEYVTITFAPWEDSFQRKLIKEATNYEPMRVIVRGGQDIGLLTVERKEDCLWLDQLYILPDYQGRGLGATIVKHLKQIASSERLPLRLSVLVSNTRARRLYEREGFVVYEQTPQRTRMEYQ